MDFKKFAAVFAVAVMMITAVAVVGDEISADEYDGMTSGTTLQMVPEVDTAFQRTTHKISYFPDNYSGEDVFCTDERYDDLFVKYINGESKDFLKKIVKDPVEMKQYYIYLVGGYEYRNDYTVTFHRDAPTLVHLPAGESSVRLMSQIDHMELVVGWEKLPLKYDVDTDVKLYYTETVFITTEAYDFKHLQPVYLELYDEALVPEKYVPQETVELSTNLEWFHGTIDVVKGDVWGGGIFMFAPGSDNEARFVEDVIRNHKTDYKLSDYGITQGEFPAGTYSIYSVDRYAYLGDAGNHKLSQFQEMEKPYTAYTRANSSFTVALDFDDTKYRAIVQTGYSTCELSSGYKYTFQTVYASEMYVYLEALDDNNASVSEQVRMEIGGTETTTGSPTGFAALCVVLAVLVFAVLFISNKKPHW